MTRRILLTIDALNMSGVAFAVQNLITGFQRKKAELMILAKSSGERDSSLQRVPIVVNRWFGVPLLGRAAYRAAKEFNPSVIHSQCTEVALASHSLATSLGVPLVVTANRLDDSSNLDGLPGITVVALSDAIRERLINRAGIRREKIHVIPNGLDLDLFPRPVFPPSEQKLLPVIGTYGTLAKHKGQRTFLQAARHVLDSGIDAEFLVLGHGPDKPELRRLAEELRVNKRVTFAPSTSCDGGSLSRIDLFIEPTYEEGLGLSVLQSMACGVPVIASGVGGIFSLIKDGETGRLVSRGDPKALSEAICEMLADPASRREMARAARDTVEENFSTEHVAGQLLSLYDTILQ